MADRGEAARQRDRFGGGGMQIYGHRGSSGTDPENTLRAFRQAIVADADGVELDVHLSADGTPVVIHDADVSRTTSGTGSVASMSLAELRELDAGEGERVPTLDEVIGVLAGKLTIDIELKQAEIGQAVVDVLAGYPDATWFASCFEWNELIALRRLSPTASLWPLSRTFDDALFAIADELESPGIALHYVAYTADVADQCKAAGLEVGVWTVNDPAEGRRVKALGAAALMTDFPAMMRAALN